MTTRTATTLAAVASALSATLAPAPSALAQQGTTPAITDDTAVAFGIAGDDAERRLEAYLDTLGLLELRAEHMAARLEATRDEDQREELIQQLATTYANLLERAPTLDEQRTWERHAHQLLDEAEGDAAAQLRLGLARAAFSRVETSAEAWILRTASQADRASALRRVGEVEQQLIDIAQDATRRVERLEAQEERAPAELQERIARDLAAANRRRSIARYLAGWSAAYAAELARDHAERHDAAQRGLRHLGWLLNAPDDAEPTLDRLRDNTLVYEHVARAAVLSTTLRAHLGQSTRAIRWLDALADAPDLHPDARDQLFLRRAVALALGNQWRWLSRTLEDRRQTAEHTLTLSTGEARRLAILAFEALAELSEASADRQHAANVRDAAIAELVADGELGHVLDLADRYGFRSLGGDSFVADQIRGLVVYGEAREDHRAFLEDNPDSERTPSDPVPDPRIAERYRNAAAHFAAALDAPDAAAFPRAIANTAMLRGLALFYAGATSADAEAPGLLDAADLFVQAADSLEQPDPDRAAEALWLAIRAHDLQLEALPPDDSTADAIRIDRQQLIRRFLTSHPAHQRAAALRLRRALESDLPPERKLQLLDSIPDSSALAEHARRQAARIAYQAFRDATDERRPAAAARYIELAQPLLVADRRRAEPSNADAHPDAARLAALHARRIVEAILDARVPDLQHAQRTLDVLLGLLERDLITDPGTAADIRNEIDYRQAQIALHRGDNEAAAQRVDRLIKTDTRFATAARRLFYRHAEDAFRRAQDLDNPTAIAAAAQRLIQLGRPLIEHADTLPADEQPTGILSVHAALADAHAALHRHAASDDHRDRALTLYNRVLEAHPRNTRALRGAADMAEAAGMLDTALQHRRRILAGAERSSDDWFAAKLQHLTLLARIDPDRARTALRQHAALYPNWGPDPFGTRLRALAEQLDDSTPGTTPHQRQAPDPQ